MAAQTPLICSVDIWPTTWAPRGWTLCHGQLLSISQYDAVFSIIGTKYGGDGRASFGIPDLRGRSPIGAGQGPGLSNYALGASGGVETRTLTVAQMSHHNHIATLSSSIGLTGNVKMPVKTGLGSGTNDPDGKYLGPSGSVNLYYASPTAEATLAPVAVNVRATAGTIDVTDTGLGQAFEIAQPFTTVNFIMALEGLYPSRN